MNRTKIKYNENLLVYKEKSYRFAIETKVQPITYVLSDSGRMQGIPKWLYLFLHTTEGKEHKDDFILTETNIKQLCQITDHH